MLALSQHVLTAAFCNPDWVEHVGEWASIIVSAAAMLYQIMATALCPSIWHNVSDDSVHH